MDSSVPLLTLFTNYSEWKKKMIASLMRRGLYGVSIVLGEEFFSENDWMNECDAASGTMTLALSPRLRYVSTSIEDPKELQTRLDRTFGMNDEDHNSTLESTSNTISILDPKFSASTLSDEVVQNEEEAKSSSSDFPLNYVQTLPVIASESEEKFDFSPSNVPAGVKIRNTLDILEEITGKFCTKFNRKSLEEDFAYFSY